MGTWEVFRWSIRNWYDEMLLFVAIGLVTFIAQIPFAAIAYMALQLPPLLFPIGVPLLMPFLPSPAIVGIYAVARAVARYEDAGWGVFWGAMRKYWLHTLALYFIGVFITVLLRGPVEFYIRSGNPLLSILGFVLLYLLLWWLTVQLFIIPALLEQPVWQPIQVYRQAVMVLLLKPFVALGALVLTVVIVLLGAFTVIGLPIMAMPIYIVLCQHVAHYAWFGKPELGA